MRTVEVAFLIAKYREDTGNTSFTYRQLIEYARKHRPDLHPNTIERCIRRLAEQGVLAKSYVRSRRYRKKIAVFQVTDELYRYLLYYGVRR